MAPRISIITPSFQHVEFLPECLASVKQQGYSDVEHIVVDGGSTDGSALVIEEAREQLKWCCSEKDRGQAHAINKGLEHASGKVFGWINSDDALLPGALEHVGRAFENDPDLLIYEGIRIVERPGIGPVHQPLNDPLDTEALFTSPHINQQSTFFDLQKVKEIGGVDEALQFVMDYELWLQLLFRFGTAGIRTEPVPLARFRMHPANKTSTSQDLFVDEMAGVLHGLALSVGHSELADILNTVHAIPKGLRGIPVGPEQQERVARMIVHFLLRWDGVVHNERQFEGMRKFLRTDHSNASWLTTFQRDRIEQITEQVRVPGWIAFRVKRKWHHLWQ